MAKESQTANNAIRREQLTHDPCKETEHTPRGNPQDDANPGKNHAIPATVHTRAEEQERSQGPSTQTPTRQQTENCHHHGPPPAPPPSPEYDATPPMTQGERRPCTIQHNHELNWQVVPPSKQQSRLKTRQEGTNPEPRRSGRTLPTISYKGM